MINKIFNLLDEWRNLPAYQLERRADIYFAIHLEEIVKKKLQVELDIIIPEFPLRVGNIYEKMDINKSFKIDYLGYAKSTEKCFLIELKTDSISRNKKQDWYLKRASEIKVAGITDGLIKIYNATTHKDKYNNLAQKVEEMGWIKNENGTWLNLMKDITPKILYIQPQNLENAENVISFNDIIGYFSESTEPLTKRFMESLERWKQSPK